MKDFDSKRHLLEYFAVVIFWAVSARMTACPSDIEGLNKPPCVTVRRVFFPNTVDKVQITLAIFPNILNRLQLTLVYVPNIIDK